MKLNNMGKHNGRRKGGRPPTRPAVLKDGFYFEVRNRATDPGTGVKIWKPSHDEMMQAAEKYRETKLVLILGAYKDGVALNAAPRKKKAA